MASAERGMNVARDADCNGAYSLRAVPYGDERAAPRGTSKVTCYKCEKLFRVCMLITPGWFHE